MAYVVNVLYFQQAQQAILPEQEPLTAAMLIAAPPAAQKWMLGVKLFPLVAVMRADLAGKITATLLEIDNAELLHMLDSQDALKVKVRMSSCWACVKLLVVYVKIMPSQTKSDYSPISKTT